MHQEARHLSGGLEGEQVWSYVGTQGVRVMTPPSLASGSHCSNVRTLCTKPPPLTLKIGGVRVHCPAMGVAALLLQVDLCLFHSSMVYL